MNSNLAFSVSRYWLPRRVVVLSLVSFLNDVASDIVVPLIPIVLASLLAAGPAAHSGPSIAFAFAAAMALASAPLIPSWVHRGRP